MTIDKQTLCIENAFDIENQLYELANNEISCDSFAVTSTNENGTEIEFERPITDLALEAASTINALLKRLESKEKLVADTASQLDVQIARGNALAAESAGLKELIEQHANSVAVCPNCSHEEPSETDDIVALYRSMETPATDVFLAEVRASAIEAFADNQAKIADEELVGGNLDLSLRFRGMARAAKEFAAQIRQESAK